MGYIAPIATEPLEHIGFQRKAEEKAAPATRWQGRVWIFCKRLAASAAMALGPTAVMLAIAALAYLLFPPLSAAFIGYAIGWFILRTAMYMESYYEKHYFVAIRSGIQWLEERCPGLHLIAFIFATIIAIPCGWAGIVVTLLPGAAMAAMCDTRQFLMLQKKNQVSV